MKLLRLTVKRYRSLLDQSIDLNGDVNLFIGANASGKSYILDVLRFLHEGVRAGDFRVPVNSRGGIVHLAWKGAHAQQIELALILDDDGKRYEWSVRLVKEDGPDFQVFERVEESHPGKPPSIVLEAEKGAGWWWSGEEGRKVDLKRSQTICALAAASADASFPARGIAECVERWGFFDPSPFLLRRDWASLDSAQFDPYGRNLAETLYRIERYSPDVFERIVEATRSVVGLPSKIETRESEDRFYFVQHEPGLQYPVHQMGISSGTLRMLALMTALYGDPEPNLMGIEEPENYVHPTAISSFVEHLKDARERAQFMVTTHSPLLLDCLGDPESMFVVRRDESRGTVVQKQENADGVRDALDESGFGLGEFYHTKGFGG